MVRAAPRAMPGLSKSLSARLGGKPVKGAEGAPRLQVDARLKIIQKSRSNTVDARDKLAKMAKTMDARQKLEKIRNMKEGKLEVKKIGAITLTKKTGGKIVLTTSKAAARAASTEKREPVEVKAVGQFLKTTSITGQVTFQSKSSKKTAEGMRSSRPESGGGRVAVGPGRGVAGVGRHGQGPLNASKKRFSNEELDDVLMNTAIDPRELSKIRSSFRSAAEDRPPVQRYRDTYDRVRSRSRSPLARSRSPLGRSRSPLGRSRSPLVRSRSPLGRPRSPLRGDGGGVRDEWRGGRRELSPPPLRRPAGGRVYDYDDPRALEQQREDEALRRRLSRQPEATHQDERITLGGRLEHGSTISPLQGTKVVITNLQTTVTQEDIMELFGDVGPLKRAKLVTPGHAEVYFVNQAHAKRAVDVYHNRQLDGKPMRCQLVGASSVAEVGGPTIKLPASLSRKRREGEEPLGPKPDVDAIHKALFKKTSGKKPSFTITLPKKTKDEEW